MLRHASGPSESIVNVVPQTAHFQLVLRKHKHEYLPNFGLQTAKIRKRSLPACMLTQSDRGHRTRVNQTLPYVRNLGHNLWKILPTTQLR